MSLEYSHTHTHAKNTPETCAEKNDTCSIYKKQNCGTKKNLFAILNILLNLQYYYFIVIDIIIDRTVFKV